MISKEPLGLLVRKGDGRWFDLVRWTHSALVTAEELRIVRETVDAAAAIPNSVVQRFLGRTGERGTQLGVENEWAAKVICAFGKFGELWERHVTPLGAPRGVNRLWTQGGLQHTSPMR